MLRSELIVLEGHNERIKLLFCFLRTNVPLGNQTIDPRKFYIIGKSIPARKQRAAITLLFS